MALRPGQDLLSGLAISMPRPSCAGELKRNNSRMNRTIAALALGFSIVALTACEKAPDPKVATVTGPSLALKQQKALNRM